MSSEERAADLKTEKICESWMNPQTFNVCESDANESSTFNCLIIHKYLKCISFMIYLVNDLYMTFTENWVPSTVVKS